jgi:hypothetical protein
VQKHVGRKKEEIFGRKQFRASERDQAATSGRSMAATCNLTDYGLALLLAILVFFSTLVLVL